MEYNPSETDVIRLSLKLLYIYIILKILKNIKINTFS